MSDEYDNGYSDGYDEGLAECEGAKEENIRLRAELQAVTAERDAFAARLAPVEDEALLKMVDEIVYVRSVMIGTSTDEIAREVITHIRPHIEAAERERCAAALEITSDEIRLHAGEMTAQEMRSVLAVLTWRAAAIRSGK